MKPEDKERLKKYKPNYNLTYDDIYGKPKVANTNVVYMDENGNVIDDSEAAKKASIIQEDELGRMIEETIGFFEGETPEHKKSR